ncbi:MAG: VOC family protein [Burkholderiales bacterium]
MNVQPYLFFNGRCDEALEFYRTSLGAKIDMLMRFKERPDPPLPGTIPPNWGDKAMHAHAHIGDSQVMLSDGMGNPNDGFKGLSISVSDEASADRIFNALSAGGQVQMLLGKTFWSPHFGMVTDRFGVGWMVVMDDPA